MAAVGLAGWKSQSAMGRPSGVGGVEMDAGGAPEEFVGGDGAGEGHGEGLAAVVETELRGPDGEAVHLVILRVAPAGGLDIDLVLAILADIRRGIGEEAEDDVLVELVDGTVDGEVVGAEAEFLPREYLGAIPLAVAMGELEMERAVFIDPGVGGGPIGWGRAGPGRRDGCSRCSRRIAGYRRRTPRKRPQAMRPGRRGALLSRAQTSVRWPSESYS